MLLSIYECFQYNCIDYMRIAYIHMRPNVNVPMRSDVPLHVGTTTIHVNANISGMYVTLEMYNTVNNLLSRIIYCIF